ncbi:Gastrula zinc finger protein XlCGF58.1 [Orchesella cincta]|uniref:Gastrula zinc finger protein XlCGF58.1 n=1 Tax=Orchesella cincta TaxID=48709 RepID=A0A1D2MJH0_ORCCI|nr:Gastrula zinc finger protein XlCGF58.1 [Orchesella cincta]
MKYTPIVRKESHLAEKNRNEVTSQPATRSKATKSRQTDNATSPSHKCSECNFTASTQKELESHLELHQPGSKSERCKSCGWVLKKGMARWHMKQHHPEKCPGGAQRKKAPFRYLTCVECGHKFCAAKKLRQHMKLHNDGEGESCLDCGWLVKSERINFHFRDWHPEEGSAASELRKRTEKYPVLVRPSAYKVKNTQMKAPNLDNAHSAAEDP